VNSLAVVVKSVKREVKFKMLCCGHLVFIFIYDICLHIKFQHIIIFHGQLFTGDIELTFVLVLVLDEDGRGHVHRDGE
jgi:hypothetical protein